MPTKEVPEEIGRMILTAAWTGMRMGELRAVRWVDLKDGEINIKRSVHIRTEKEVKNKEPRFVVVPEPLAIVLADQRKWLMETLHPGLVSGLIFPASERHAKAGASRRGVEKVSWFRSGSVLKLALARIVEKANVTPISPHSFRRTYENLLRKAGVNDLVRRSLAGWRTEDAQAIYASHDREERDGAGAALVMLVKGSERPKASPATPAATPGS